MSASIADILAHVSPVVRPLLATTIPTDAFSPLPAVDEVPGGAAARVPLARGRPSSIIAPLPSTVPEFTSAIAASTLVELELSGSHVDKKPINAVPGPSPFGVQLLSI